LLVKKFIHFT